MSGVGQLEDGVEASTSGMMETTMMEGEEYYNPDDSGTWTQKEMAEDQLCRICAKPNQYLIPIFEGEGIEHQLEPKIQKHLPIEVSETDDLPLQVCYQCASTLIAWNDLVIACIEADKKLRQIHEQEEDDKGVEIFDEPILDSDDGEEPDQPSTSIGTIVTDIPSDTTVHPKRSPGKAKKPKLKMTLVKSPTAGPSGLKGPVKKPTATKPQDIAVQEASERYEETPTVNNFSQINAEGSPAVQTRHIKTESGTMMVDISRNTQGFKEEKVASVDGSIDPVTTSFEDNVDPMNCQFCQVVCNSAVSLSCHNRTHLGNNDYICVICDEPFESEIGLTVHDELCHRTRKKPRELCDCDICGKILTSYNRLLDHMEGHKGDRQFSCELCDLRFLTESSLKTHFSFVHDNTSYHETYICDTCGKCYKTKKDLTDHIRSHLEQPLPCEVCGKSFKSRPVLLAHQKFHVEALPHQCEYCSKTFQFRGHLVAHKRTHTKDYSEPCDMCGKVFNSWHCLQKHMRIHSDKTPYMCNICGRGFKQRGGQLAHLRSHQRYSLKSMKKKVLKYVI